jgi:WD40 repeat protein
MDNTVPLPCWHAGVAVLPDGAWEAKLEEYKPSGALLQHGDSVNSLLSFMWEDSCRKSWNCWFSPDASCMAGVSHNLFGVWDTTTGRKLYNLDGHQYHITSVQFSPSGGPILSGSVGKTIRMWDISTPNSTGQLQTRSVSILGTSDMITFSPRRIILSSQKTSNVGIWDIDTGYFLRNISDSTRKFLAVSPSGTHVAFVSPALGITEIYNISNQKRLVMSLGSGASKLSFSYDGHAFATISPKISADNTSSPVKILVNTPNGTNMTLAFLT